MRATTAAQPKKTQNRSKLERRRDAPSMTDMGYARFSLGISTIYSSATFLLFSVR